MIQLYTVCTLYTVCKICKASFRFNIQRYRNFLSDFPVDFLFVNPKSTPAVGSASKEQTTNCASNLLTYFPTEPLAAGGGGGGSSISLTTYDQSPSLLDVAMAEAIPASTGTSVHQVASRSILDEMNVEQFKIHIEAYSNDDGSNKRFANFSASTSGASTAVNSTTNTSENCNADVTTAIANRHRVVKSTKSNCDDQQQQDNNATDSMSLSTSDSVEYNNTCTVETSMDPTTVYSSNPSNPRSESTPPTSSSSASA